MSWLSKNALNCPFFEAHAGAYFQGCWEYNDICYAAPSLQREPYCHQECFRHTLDERDILDAFLGALRKPALLYHDGYVKTRVLTKTEKENIIENMETCFKIFNDYLDKPLIYK